VEACRERISIIVNNLRKIGIVLFWLLVWQLLAMLVDNPILFVTPWQTVCALVGLLTEAVFWRTVCMSLLRITAGFVLGMLMGLLLALLSKRYSLIEALLAPIITLCKTVPVAVFVVLLLIWWGSSVLAVAICFLIVLPIIYISTLEGLKSTDKKLLEMAKVFEFPKATKFFYIYRPALKSFLSSGLKQALGMCWKSGVAAEVIGTPAFSIGEQLYLSKIHLNTSEVFAWAAVIILLSVGFERLVLWLTGEFWKWEPACGRKVRKDTAKQVLGYCPRDVKLCVENVSKSYDSQTVIRNLNAVYEGGETYYLTTPSGSGKTTLLRIMCGLEMPDEGKVDSGLSYGMVFQEDRLCEDYSALRNVEMVTGSNERARKALEQLLNADALHKPCCQLSGGMKRRVALVRAMESESDCVLLDEPFTGMDADTRLRAEAYIKERQRGRILIVATHI